MRPDTWKYTTRSTFHSFMFVFEDDFWNNHSVYGFLSSLEAGRPEAIDLIDLDLVLYTDDCAKNLALWSLIFFKIFHLYLFQLLISKVTELFCLKRICTTQVFITDIQSLTNVQNE